MTAIKIGIVAGEESGDLLGADLIAALRGLTDRPLQLVGVGGPHMAGQGLQSLFDPHEFALMGFTDVIGKIPRLLGLISRTANHLIASRPDILIIIDSPGFTHRVARKVRAAMPALPVVNYGCPTVWAWREGRARAMRAYVDHVLCLLPFEPAALQRLDGPPGTYVGHKLANDAAILRAGAAQAALENDRARDGPRTLLVLPGSRKGEVARSMPVLTSAVSEMASRTKNLSLLLPTLPRLETDVRAAVAGWAAAPEIVTGHDEKMRMFSRADAALAVSGTVTLELALCGVPTVAFYKTGLIERMVMPLLVKTWSASLPNLIADEPLVPESYNEQAVPGRLARQLMQVAVPGPARAAQVEGFQRLRDMMRTNESAGLTSARIVMGLLDVSVHP